MLGWCECVCAHCEHTATCDTIQRTVCAKIVCPLFHTLVHTHTLTRARATARALLGIYNVHIDASSKSFAHTGGARLAIVQPVVVASQPASWLERNASLDWFSVRYVYGWGKWG